MPDAVEARFYVAQITRSAHTPKGAASVTMQAVSRGDQNKHWASATPSGQITMTINNEPAATWFADHLGDDIAVTFIAVPVANPEDGHPYRPSEAEPGTYYSAPKCGDCMGAESDHASQR